jgi:hypothetical protein
LSGILFLFSIPMGRHFLWLLVATSIFHAGAELELVTDNLPTIEELLAELELSHLSQKFYDSGMVDCRAS